jgi:hypothetical protein
MASPASPTWDQPSPASNQNLSQPDWLKDVDVEASGTANMSSVDFAAPPSGDFIAPPMATTSDDDKSGSRLRRFCKTLIFCISLGFLAIFIYSAIVQDNDVDNNMMWLIFYAIHAGAVSLYILARLCFIDLERIITKPFFAVLGSVAIWSIILVITTSVSYKDTASGGSDKGGDSDRLNDKEEKALEIAGAAIGLSSALYHMVAWKFCVAKSK